MKHITVLKQETIDNLNIDPTKNYVDCTLGGGGHSLEIVKKLSSGKLIALDQDDYAIQRAKENFSEYTNALIVKSNFSNIRNVLIENNIDKIHGVIMDLGVSNFQLEDESRGFSYRFDAQLDMRMDKQNAKDAAFVVNNYSEEDLANVFFRYGEEKKSRRIANRIVRERAIAPIETTAQLAEFIVSVKGHEYGKHPARQVFQALRIEVNDELNILENVLDTCIDILEPGGRICIITFHSLEDRIVKQNFVKNATECTCPNDLPICVCSTIPKVKIITRKPILPSAEELELNYKSRSAKLRVAEKRIEV